MFGSRTSIGMCIRASLRTQTSRISLTTITDFDPGYHSGENEPSAKGLLLSLLLQPRQELNEVADLGLRQLAAEVLRHRRFRRAAVVDVVLRHRQQLSLRRDDRELLRILGAQHAADGLAVERRHDHGVVPLGDVLVRQHDRGKQVVALLLGANAVERRADVAPLAVELVAALARRRSMSQEQVAALFGIAANQGLAKGGEVIVLWAARFVAL